MSFKTGKKHSKSRGHTAAKYVHMQRYDSAREERGLRTEDTVEAETRGVQTEKRWYPVDHQKRESSRRHASKTSKRVGRGISNGQDSTCTYVNKLKYFYTNTATLLNKRLELCALIYEYNPDVIGITETRLGS
jgi:hypothetical protein